MAEEKKIYGMLAVAPINFPNEVEMRIYPHDKKTGLQYGGFYSYAEHKTWQWVRSFVPLVPHAWADIEMNVKDGKCAALGLGEYSIDLPDGMKGPGIIEEA